jgi:serine/threonine protein kinase
MRTLTFNRILGSGAMGTVYQAELKAPGGFVRPCAVKVMKGSGPDREQFMGRMRDEARLLGMLQDEQVIGVSELVSVGERDAVIMDYVEGIDLSELLGGKGVPPRALCEMGAEIAGTLYRAHKARHPSTGVPLNVIHRDIKPANVMITSRGGVRLLDFGVARAAFSDRESHTQGLVLGTLNYFPPEVLAGYEPTPAVDIYGLGLTLWECATGKPWGTPQAQQQRFERRVDQRIAELPDDFRFLVPVLRSILQWDPKLRPDGGVVERALLHAAGQCPGDGLRTWAREVIPDALRARDRASEVKKDELVGKTLQVQGLDSTPEADAQTLTAPAPVVPPPATVPRATPPAPPQRPSTVVRTSAPPVPAPATPSRSLVPVVVAAVAVGALLATVLIVIVLLAVAVALS